MKRGASPSSSPSPSPAQKRTKPEATPSATTTPSTSASTSASPSAAPARTGLPVSSLINAPQPVAHTAAPPSRPILAPPLLLRDPRVGLDGRRLRPAPASHRALGSAHMSRLLSTFNSISPTSSHFVSPTNSGLVSPTSSLSSPSRSSFSLSPTRSAFNSPTRSSFSALSATSYIPNNANVIHNSVPTHRPASQPSSSSSSSIVPPDYDHYRATREFNQARRNGVRITLDASPTFSGRNNSATRANNTPAPTPQASLSTSSSMSPPPMHPDHSYRYGDVQQPSQTGPIRTSTSRGGYSNQAAPHRHTSSRFQSLSATSSPTTPSFDRSQDYSQGYTQSYSQGSSQNSSYNQGHSQSSRRPNTPLLNSSRYRHSPLPPPHRLPAPQSMPPSRQLSPFQYPCKRPESSGSGATQRADAISANMSQSLNPVPTAPTWATDPGSAPLPLPVPLQSRRPDMNLGVSHASAFERPRHFAPTPAHSPMTGGLAPPGQRSTQSLALGRANAIATPPSTAPTPQLTPSATLSASRSPTPATTPGQGMLNMAPDQVATHLQILAAHVGLDVHFTPKMACPSTARSKTGFSSATPEPRRSATPKLTPPGTSSGKSSRRPSFATLLPSGRAAPPKRSRPGQWTLEKRLIFVDRLMTAGYKSVSLSDLAEELELKKKQLVNQLTPGRTGSIRELCMNAAARILDPCTECKKKQACAKRKADSEGLGDYLLRGVSERVEDEDDELDGEEMEEEEGDELMEEDTKEEDARE